MVFAALNDGFRCALPILLLVGFAALYPSDVCSLKNQGYLLTFQCERSNLRG